MICTISRKVQQLTYQHEYNAAVDRRRYRTQKQYEEEQRKHAERELQLRTKPSEDDIRKGDALNALLSDLSDPMIQPSAWRGAQVPLPEDISIHSLAMRFAPKPGAKGSAELSRGLIALGRLDLDRGWPEYIPEGVLVAERRAYQAAFAKLREQCLAGKLDSKTVDELDRAVVSLLAKAATDVPTNRNYRNCAVAFFRGLKEATTMFNAETYSYAKEMIRDTNQHEAHTVGELLAFMRKYRLLFAKADAAPGGEEMYRRLYGLLHQQAESLGLKPGQGLAGTNIPGDAKLFQGKNYKAFNEEMTWHEAKAKCETLGGQLAIIKSESESRFVNSLVEAAGLETAWLGATDEQNEGVWIWVDGSRMSYDNWYKAGKQPNNKGAGEHCLMIVMATGRQWSDQPDRAQDGYHPGFVCQWNVERAKDRITENDTAVAFQKGTIWVGSNHVLTVLDRNGSRFRAKFVIGNGQIIREVTGTIEGDTIKWLGKDDIAIKGSKGGDNIGVIQGDEMAISWSSNGGPLRSGLILKLNRN